MLRKNAANWSFDISPDAMADSRCFLAKAGHISRDPHIVGRIGQDHLSLSLVEKRVTAA